MLKNWYVNFTNRNHHSWRIPSNSPIRPSKSLDYVCKTKWWSNKFLFFTRIASSWQLYWLVIPTQTVCPARKKKRFGFDEMEINHQPVNKSVSISLWIVAFSTLEWIWYFFFYLPLSSPSMTFMISTVHRNQCPGAVNTSSDVSWLVSARARIVRWCKVTPLAHRHVSLTLSWSEFWRNSW